MRRLKEVFVETTVLGRNGKSKHRTPLTVGSSPKVNSRFDEPAPPSADELNLSDHDPHETVLDFTAPGISQTCQRNVSNYFNWERIRTELLNANVEDSALPENSLCKLCNERPASTRCQYCGPKQFFCAKCSQELHSERNQFHVLEQWKNNRFIPLFPNHGIVSYGHNCSSKILKLFKLVDAFGNQHLKQVAVCECESHSVTLVKCHFWPGSPDKPTVGFHFKLMDLAEKLFLHSQVSLSEFAEILFEITPPLQPHLITSLYSILNSGCFEEYRHHKYQVRYLKLYVPELYDGTDCPLCPTENGVLIESVDACFGLARKKSKGGYTISSRHGNRFFSDQDDVDNFVDNYQQTGYRPVNQDCSRFHAGEVLPAIRGKGKNKLFDEKGVFGRVCRHDFPKSLLSIKHGERISYSVYELKKLKESISSKSLKVVLMYDIACILSSHLKNTGQEELLTDVDLAIPIFHCYGHKVSCQIGFSPRRTSNIGLTDGEGVERFWSFLRQFSKITKEMSVDKRVDVLTDATLHYGEHLFYRFGPILKAKLKRTTALLSTVEDGIKLNLAAFPELTNLESVKQWITDEKSVIAPTENVLEYQWDESYTDMLMTDSKLRNELTFAKEEDSDRVEVLEKKINRNEKSIKALEKKNGIRIRWKKEDRTFVNSRKRLVAKKVNEVLLKLQRLASERMFLLELKAKYADGQAIAIKLAHQINKVVSTMNKNLALLNGLGDAEVTFDGIKDPSGDMYHPIHHISQHETPSVPFQTKKQLIDLVCLLDRCKEEETMIKEEMLRLVHFILAQIEIMNTYVNGSSSKNRGIVSLILQKSDCCKKYVQVLKQMWGDVITFPLLETCEDTYLLFNSIETEEYDEVESICDFSLLEDIHHLDTNISSTSEEDWA